MPIYMKYEGINGLAKEKHHTGWIELYSFQLGDNTGIPTGDGRLINRNKAIASKYMDNTSGLIMRDSLNEKGRKITIDHVEQGQSVSYLTIELENAMIASYQVSKNDAVPMETFTIDFSKLTIKHVKSK